jgi:ATP-dependent Clp protease ATP-binding subunit ClpA
VGIRGKDRAIANLLFCGPTGTGKTEVSKALSFFFFGSEESMVRIDMAEYSLKESVTKMIGVPPGYEGHNTVPGRLTGPMRQNSRRVVLFDEVEKSHPAVQNLMLQIMEEGRIRDAMGFTVRFFYAVVIVTSNVGSFAILEGTKSDTGLTGVVLKEIVKKALRAEFAPEYLNRFDEIVIFNPFERDLIALIIKILFRVSQDRLAILALVVNLTRDATRMLNCVGYSATQGARPVKRIFGAFLDFSVAWCGLARYIGLGSGVCIYDVGFGGPLFVDEQDTNSDIRGIKNPWGLMVYRSIIC